MTLRRLEDFGVNSVNGVNGESEERKS